MSGHSKWAQIKRKKGVADVRRGMAFSKTARMITLAAKTGSDPNTNFRLRLALESAKKINMPQATILRAIKGASKEGAVLEEVMYEVYGPFGVALLIQVVTDNKNRASSQVKSTLTKFGGSMGRAGSVSWIFEQKGLITIEKKGMDEETKENLELKAIDLGAEDIKEEDELLEIYTAPQKAHKIAEELKKEGFKIESESLEMRPKNIVKIEESTKADKILKLMNALEDLEDVDQVYANFDIPTKLLEEVTH